MPIAKSSSKTLTSLANKSERLILSEHIAKCATTMDKFLEATQEFRDYKTDIFADLDRQIEAKKQELNDVTAKITTEEEETRISTKQRLQEYKRTAALQILNESEEVAISSEELTELKADLEELRASKEETIETEVNKVRSEEHKTLQVALNSMKLTHQAEIAVLKATSEQKEKEVDVLHSAIDDLKHEIGEQRSLTRDVASSLKSGAITLNAGKAN
jgi:hypothetical protein